MQENPTTAVTIAELEQRSLEVAEAESRALRALADHLREAAVQLPRDSTMGMRFAKHAQGFDSTASFVDHHIDAVGTLALQTFTLETDRDVKRRYGPTPED